MPGIHRPGGARHTLKLGAEGWVPSTQVGVGVVFIYLLTYLETCRILVQQPRIKTMPPALADGPLTTGPPGKLIKDLLKLPFSFLPTSGTKQCNDY